MIDTKHIAEHKIVEREIDHKNIAEIGDNSHIEIDDHIADIDNPHNLYPGDTHQMLGTPFVMYDDFVGASLNPMYGITALGGTITINNQSGGVMRIYPGVGLIQNAGMFYGLDVPSRRYWRTASNPKFEARVRIPHGSYATTNTFLIGFDIATFSTGSEAAYIGIESGTYGDLSLNSAHLGVEQQTVIGSFDYNSWNNFKVDIDGTNGSIIYYKNDTVIGRHITQVASGTMFAGIHGFRIGGFITSPTLNLDVDYIKLEVFR